MQIIPGKEYRANRHCHESVVMSKLIILKSQPAPFAASMLKLMESADSLLLLQDAVLEQFTTGSRIFVSGLDLEARGVDSPYQLLDYAEIAMLIKNHDTVLFL